MSYVKYFIKFMTSEIHKFFIVTAVTKTGYENQHQMVPNMRNKTSKKKGF